MSEQQSQPERDKQPQVPTEEELREFEEFRAAERRVNSGLFNVGGPEDIADDPEHPTAEDIATVDTFMEGMGWLTTFEEWFGYPDPRQKPASNESPSHPSDKQV